MHCQNFFAVRASLLKFRSMNRAITPMLESPLYTKIGDTVCFPAVWAVLIKRPVIRLPQQKSSQPGILSDSTENIPHYPEFMNRYPRYARKSFEIVKPERKIRINAWGGAGRGGGRGGRGGGD